MMRRAYSLSALVVAFTLIERVFEDLQRIASRELGNLMRSVQSETLVTALQTATELAAKLLANPVIEDFAVRLAEPAV